MPLPTLKATALSAQSPMGTSTTPRPSPRWELRQRAAGGGPIQLSRQRPTHKRCGRPLASRELPALQRWSDDLGRAPLAAVGKVRAEF
mmetsp:Transcript_35383/g.77441  ORF Transcript_35383/g.77441 Transcript_35383/m.77441 type:complete len:88 (+) Transcript_35383:85-348(+)